MQVGVVAHTVIIALLIVAYVIVTSLGNDGTALLGVLGGYVGGAASQATITQAATRKANGG